MIETINDMAQLPGPDFVTNLIGLILAFYFIDYFASQKDFVKKPAAKIVIPLSIVLMTFSFLRILADFLNGLQS